MGTLRCYDWVTDPETGEKRSAVQGLTFNGVLLGEPLELDGDPATAEFDDAAFPNGVIDAEGYITPDEEPVV